MLSTLRSETQKLESNKLKTPRLDGCLRVSAFLYLCALVTSMSAMELFGWTTAFLVFLKLFFTMNGVQSKSFRFRVVPDSVFVLWIFVGALGLFLSAPREAFWVGLGSMRWIVLLYALSFWMTLDRRWEIYVKTILVLGTCVAIYGIFQHFTGRDLRFEYGLHADSRVTIAPFTDAAVYQVVGFFGHHLTYGYTFGMILCFALAAWILSQNKKSSSGLVLLLPLFLLGLSVYWTYGRGVWISMAVASLVMMFFVKKSYLIRAALGGIILVGCLFVFSHGFRARLATIPSLTYFSNTDRLDLWRANWEMFKDHPLFGVGNLRNEEMVLDYYSRLGIENTFVGHAHNSYINFLSTNGFLGLLCYLIVMGYFLKLTYRLWVTSNVQEVWTRIVILGSLGSQIFIHVGGLTQCNFKDAIVKHFFVFTLAIVASLGRFNAGPEFQD